MKPINRRGFLKRGVLASAATILPAKALAAAPTPPEVKGPFYPFLAQKDTDFDLTVIDGHANSAKGKIISLSGEVRDTQGNPIENAKVELWQANAKGRYNHPYDSNPEPVDPDFQGWAIVLSGVKGAFQFKTIMPGAYPVSEEWTRPPHLHFKITKKGYVELITQMYFPGEALNRSDRLLQRKTKNQQQQMIANQISESSFRYSIVLEKA